MKNFGFKFDCYSFLADENSLTNAKYKATILYNLLSCKLYRVDAVVFDKDVEVVAIVMRSKTAQNIVLGSDLSIDELERLEGTAFLDIFEVA